ncbi:MAG: molybdopterin-dependent oxidoreductase, partial [Otoolea sp.]
MNQENRIVRHTICDICCPSFHCGIDAHIENGHIVKIEGMKEHPASHGRICTKGLMNRQYIYHEDRLKTPMHRVGPRGSGVFEPITWEEAYGEISEKLLQLREEYGPESVMFYSGYSKWYRPFLHRLANRFGTPNFGTESSNCMFSTFLNWLVTTGSEMCRSDVANSGVFLGWAFNPYYSR